MTIHLAVANAPERTQTQTNGEGRDQGRRLDPAEVHALAVAVANVLLDDALDSAADLDLPARRGLLLLAEATQREGARRAGVEPNDGAVLREAVRDLAALERGR